MEGYIYRFSEHYLLGLFLRWLICPMQTYNILQQEPQPNFKRLTNTLAYMALENIYVGPYLGFANTDKTTEQVEYTALEK